MKLKLAAGLIVSMLPALAYAHPKDTTPHNRQEVVHDRSIKIHSREPASRRHS